MPTSVMGLVTLPCYHCFVSALNKELLKIRDNVVFICACQHKDKQVASE